MDGQALPCANARCCKKSKSGKSVQRRVRYRCRSIRDGAKDYGTLTLRDIYIYIYIYVKKKKKS